jgi:hypothetical protein
VQGTKQILEILQSTKQTAEYMGDALLSVRHNVHNWFWDPLNLVSIGYQPRREAVLR